MLSCWTKVLTFNNINWINCSLLCSFLCKNSVNRFTLKSFPWKLYSTHQIQELLWKIKQTSARVFSCLFAFYLASKLDWMLLDVFQMILFNQSYSTSYILYVRCMNKHKFHTDIFLINVIFPSFEYMVSCCWIQNMYCLAWNKIIIIPDCVIHLVTHLAWGIVYICGFFYIFYFSLFHSLNQFKTLCDWMNVCKIFIHFLLLSLHSTYFLLKYFIINMLGIGCRAQKCCIAENMKYLFKIVNSKITEKQWDCCNIVKSIIIWCTCK